MLTEDYLMRMLRLATAALARAIGLKAVELYQDAIWVIDQALEQLLGMRIDLINSLDDASLLASLTRDGEIDLDRLTVAADLLREQAEIYEKMNMASESEWRSVRALTFYLESALHGGSESYPAIVDHIEALIHRLAGIKLPVDTLFSLYAYSEERGLFTRAEDSLRRLINALGMREDLVQELADFYQRWISKPDAVLQAAGISRREIQERMASRPQ
jgi:hypothetical protein